MINLQIFEGVESAWEFDAGKHLFRKMVAKTGNFTDSHGQKVELTTQFFDELVKNFKAGDEIYQQKSPFYDRSKLHVLVSLDFSDAATAKSNVEKQKRTDKDYAVSWIRSFGEGRVFYTSFAHDKRAFMDKARLTHILDGLQYTLGDLKADDKPVSK